MMKKLCFLLIGVFCVFSLYAEDWNEITTSRDYFYGEGSADTEAEASQNALNNLLENIGVNVSSDFERIYDGENKNGDLNFKERVKQCVRTYATAPLKEVKTLAAKYDKKTKRYTILKYILRSDLESIYQERILRLKDMIASSDIQLSFNQVGTALQYYYYAYTLLRSLQHPNKVVDEHGVAYINTLPQKIQHVLNDIKIEHVATYGNNVDLRVTYKGNPATLDFTYNDGRTDGCEAKADGGNAYIDMATGYAQKGVFHLNIEYAYQHIEGDAEMQSVLDVIPTRVFREASKTVIASKNVAVKEPEIKPIEKPVIPQPDAVQSHKIDSIDTYVAVVNKVMEAISSKRYDTAFGCFKGRGLENFIRFVTNRKGRILADAEPKFYYGAKGKVFVRGLNMSFSVTERDKKTTLVDEVILTFDGSDKISNLAFGIGSVAENDLLCKNVGYSEETRQAILEFLENYKTAYCLRDIDYIDAIFDSTATIIIGHVAKKSTKPGLRNYEISDQGQEIISYRKYDKATYLKNLKNTFKVNNFINIKFTNNEIQWIEKEGENIFGIQIGQEYSSSTYSDVGHLFLLVDLAKPEEPVIKIRTWQPKLDTVKGWYNAGHFHK